MISAAGMVKSRQHGFTYLIALMVVATTGIAATVSYTSYKINAAKQMEAELLFRGLAYYKAIESFYYAKEPKKYPRRMDDLLKDPRYLTTHRHIRRLYLVANGDEWKIIYDAKGGIIGVYWDNAEKPIKRANFNKVFQHFENAKSYSDWKFIFQEQRPSL